MNIKINVLVIEYDKSGCSCANAFLNRNEYHITSARTGREGLSLSASICPDVILLDPALPDTDGYKILEQLRTWSPVPVLIVSALDGEQEKVKALDLGADDYVTKPFYPGELLARIRTALRHGRHTATKTYRALDLEINFDKRSVYLADRPVHLTQIEYQLLTLLAEYSGCVLSYQFLMNRLWGPYMEKDNLILRVNMANIRRKIRENPAKPQYLFTEVGVGYRMRENEKE